MFDRVLSIVTCEILAFSSSARTVIPLFPIKSETLLFNMATPFFGNDNVIFVDAQ